MHGPGVTGTLPPASSNADPAVRHLADRAEIHDVMMRYSAGVDRRDFQLVTDCFTPDVKVLGWGEFPDRDALITFISGVAHFHTTMHQMGNQFIEIDGDSAAMDTYAQLTHHHDDAEGNPLELNMSGNRYIEKLERRDGRWVIVQRGGDPEWAPTGVTATTSDEPAVQWLLDRAEIHDLMMHYALGIDLRAWDRIRNCFAQKFSATYGPMGEFTDHDALIDFIKGVEHFASTNHFLGTQLIEVDGDTARMATAAMITHRETDPDKPEWMAGGSAYVDELVREDGRWKIARRGGDMVAPPTGPITAPAPAIDDPTTRWLLDRAVIHDRIAASAFALDRRDFDLLASCFTPDARAKALNRARPEVEQWHSTCHFLNNQLIDFDDSGDEATVDTYLYLTHKASAEEMASPWPHGAQRFVDRLVRSADTWLIADRRIEHNRVKD